MEEQAAKYQPPKRELPEWAKVIIDNRGDVLARAGSPTDAAAVLGGQSLDEQRQAMELRLSHDVEEMLDATLGPDKVRAEAAG